MDEWHTIIRRYRTDAESLMLFEQNGQNHQATAALRELARTDLYFLLRYVLGRRDVEHPWLYQRIQEVQKSPDGHLDLWSREHYKSTIITSALTIQDIIRSHGEGAIDHTEACFGIFSHTRPIAKSFMRQIKGEFERNRLLIELFPDIFWDNPRAEAPLWSEDAGIVVKRQHNRREATVEAWGLVDGQPTSKHFTHMVYDDVVTLSSVTTPEMIQKTTEAWELSTNLEAGHCKRRMIGTRYHNADTYRTLMERGVASPRIYPATDDGTFQGRPVFWTQEMWEKKSHDMGPKTAATQLLQNPREGAQSTFAREDLRYYRDVGEAAGMNKYILVDPANSKTKKSDYTAMVVFGLAADRNYYVLDIIRDKLSLEERAGELLDLHRKWRPKGVGYEQYGVQADIEHIQYRQEDINYRFDITPLGGQLSKADRVERLLPIVAQHRLYLPESIYAMDWQGRRRDVIEEFLTQEYDLWPVPEHDDVLDAMARILDKELATVWPKESTPQPERGGRYSRKRKGRSWRSL
jgi:predicted phage terminase large subunit-like protein